MNNFTERTQIAGLLFLASIALALMQFVPSLAVILWVLTGILLAVAVILALKMYSRKP